MASLFRRCNGIYYHVTYDNWHRIWRSTGKRRRVEAEKYLRSLALQVDEKEEKKSPALTFSEFVTQWRTYAENKFASCTIRLYNESIRNLLRILGDRKLNAYSPLDLETFESQRLKEVSQSKTNIDFRDIKAILNVSVKWNLLDKNPCAGVKLVKIPPQRPA